MGKNDWAALDDRWLIVLVAALLIVATLIVASAVGSCGPSGGRLAITALGDVVCQR